MVDDDWGDEHTLRSDVCLFPGNCLMPGDHTSDECHTAAMLMALEPGEEDKTCPECKGNGMLRGQFVECPECDGQGIKPEYW